MIILSLRTDKPEAEIGIFDGVEEMAYVRWEAHRQLAETLHQKIQELLQSKEYKWSDINGVVVFSGPGSFTGLRIGVAVANALGMALHIPVMGVGNEDWITAGTQRLLSGENQRIVTPAYGSDAHITAPKK